MARRALYVANGDATNTAQAMSTATNYPLKAGNVAANFIDWQGGNGQATVVGTFVGATVTLQILAPDGVTWNTLGTATTFTAAGVAGFIAAAGQLRYAVTGGAPVGVLGWVSGIPANEGG